MKRETVNALVADYRNGNELALEEIFRKINPMIESASKIVERVCDDATKFDCRVLLKIKKALEDPNVNNFYSYVTKTIHIEKSDFLTRRKRKREDISIHSLEGDGDGDLGYQFESTADIEDDVMFKERVTLLAQGNPKKEMILLQWSRGAEDKAISELLAQRFGGKATGHRSFIKRFKTECRNLLA